MPGSVPGQSCAVSQAGMCWQGRKQRRLLQLGPGMVRGREGEGGGGSNRHQMGFETEVNYLRRDRFINLSNPPPCIFYKIADGTRNPLCAGVRE